MQALYEFPGTTKPRDVLELVADRSFEHESVVRDASIVTHRIARTRGEQTASMTSAASPTDYQFDSQLPFGSNRFDFLIMHEIFDQLADGLPAHSAQRFAKDLIREAVRVLRPGGMLAGCARNRLDILRWIRAHGRSRGKRALAGLPGYRTLLGAEGLVGQEIYWLLPRSDSPDNLVPVDPVVARAALGGLAQLSRGSVPNWSYFSQLAIVQCRAYPFAIESIFFSAQKTC